MWDRWRNDQVYRASQLAHNWTDEWVKYLDCIAHFGISRGPFVRGVSQSDVTTVPKRKPHRGLDLGLSLSAEVNIRKGWKENGGTK